MKKNILNQFIKEKESMRKTLGLVSLIILLIAATTMAGTPTLKPYGFVKGDMVYATKGVYSWGNPNNSYLSAAQFASGVDHAAIGFTGQHTRFGLKGTAGEEIKVGGRIELDFYYGAFDANARPRIRLAYASLAKGNVELRFGQQWDIFSPNNAATNNTNGNMWYAGNCGFRRGQIQLLYKLPVEKIAPLLQLSVGEATKEGSGLGADNKSGMPMIQGRFSAKLMGKYTLGLYFATAKFSPDPDNTDLDFSMSGFGVDFNLPVSPALALKGEFNTGTNLNNANLFTAVGSGSKDNEKKSMGLWFNAIAKPSSVVNFVLGYGMDKNQSDDIADGAIDQNTAIYGDVIFPMGNGFSIAIEVENISTKIKGGDTNSALVFDIAGKVAF